MANPEHLRIIKEGTGAWNQWRADNPQESPDFENADLSGAHLNNANLHNANLCYANLRRAELFGANLSGADLCRADLRSAKLIGAGLRGAKLIGADLSGADLSGATLIGADLIVANLRGAHLSGAHLIGTNLTIADLIGADLIGANLRDANLRDANLIGANLSGANLSGANLRGARLKSIILSEARLFNTVLGDVDLSDVIGLDTARHLGPSTIGIDTLYKSHGRIPEQFLCDAGVPKEVIEDLLPSIRSGPAIQWHSCFISYSTIDEEFARRLHSRMREANMRVWFASEDLKGGNKLHEQLFEAIQIHDRLLLLLSDHSIKSEWVMTEIRKAREVERCEKRRKLFPVRLVGYDTLRDWTCFDADSGKDLAVEVREYFIPDFSDWRSHDEFEKSFGRLQQDLKAEIQPPS